MELPQDVKLNNICVLPNNKILAGTEDGVYEVIYTALPTNSYKTVKATFTLYKLTYKIEGNTWLMDAAPYTFNGRTFVPVRYLAYALGINDSGIQWDKKNNEVTLSKDNTTVKLTPDKSIIIVNNKPVAMDVQPQIVNGRMMLPARWVAEAFGADVFWNAQEQTVIIQYLVKDTGD